MMDPSVDMCACSSLPGDGTTDCCVNVFNPVTQTFKVVGSYGNSHLGAADVRHQLIDMMAEELMSYMPGDRIDQYVDVVWVSTLIHGECTAHGYVLLSSVA